MREGAMAPEQAEYPQATGLFACYPSMLTRTALVRLWRYATVAAVMIGCAVAVIPFVPSFPTDQLDSAWAFALNAAVDRGLAFGRDIVFTFGPYASLYTSAYEPATDKLAMLSGLLVTVALAAGLLVLTPDSKRWRVVLISVLLGLLPLKDPVFLAIPLVFVAVVARLVSAEGRRYRRFGGAGVLLLLALALLPLIKATFAAATLIALGAAGALLLRKDWRLAIGAAGLFVLAMTTFWGLASQSILDLPHFLVAQAEVIGGYTEAMAMPGPVWQIAVFALIASGVLAANFRALMEAGLPGRAVWLVAAMLLFLAFKAGFIRQDMHVATGAGALALTACVLALFSAGDAPLIGLAVGLGGCLVLMPALPEFGPHDSWPRWHGAERMATFALDRLSGGSALRQGYAHALAQIRAEHRLPPLSGSTDIYADEQSIPLAYDLPWSPRPVLQSYAAWSPFLAALDAQHLAGAGAPRNVLMAVRQIDNRLPSLGDGPSWPILLAHYQAIALQNDLAVMRRLDPDTAPAPVLAPGAQEAGQLGREVPLSPGDAPLWAEIDVKPTFLGRVAAALLKPPPLGIVMRLAGGGVRAFRYIAGMGKAGFIVSPLVESTAEFLALQSPAAALFGKRVAGFTIVGDTRFWKAGYTLTIDRLHVIPRLSTHRLLFKQPLAAAAPAEDHHAQCYLDQVNGQTVDHRAPSLHLSGPVQASGWGFAGDRQGTKPDNIAVSITGADGATVAAPAMAGFRPDVGQSFHQPDLVQVGFHTMLDVSALSGTYTLALEMETHGHRWSCPLFNAVEISPPPPLDVPAR